MFFQKRIRYAVIGMGHIAQAAVLPAFRHARKNSELVAIMSEDPVKQKELSRQYGVPAFFYDEYDAYLTSGSCDAIYIALPNNMHREFTVRAARAGVHVLCEKPMASTEDECQAMIDSANVNHIKLMIAYRLHFEETNLKALQLAESGKLGEIKIFNSVFSLNVKEGNIRLKASLGGGTLPDIGIYCINAARSIFRSEPTEVFAVCERTDDPRFREVDEISSCILKFPGGRVASFTSSFGAAPVSAYRIVGTKGSLLVDPAFDYVGDRIHYITLNGLSDNPKLKRRVFKQKDQFAPELIYFSKCILKNKKPEPSGEEGLADVRIINALYKSAQLKKPIALDHFPEVKRPSTQQLMNKPPVRKQRLVKVESASG